MYLLFSHFSVSFLCVASVDFLWRPLDLQLMHPKIIKYERVIMTCSNQLISTISFVICINVQLHLHYMNVLSLSD